MCQLDKNSDELMDYLLNFTEDFLKHCIAMYNGFILRATNILRIKKTVDFFAIIRRKIFFVHGISSGKMACVSPLYPLFTSFHRRAYAFR